MVDIPDIVCLEPLYPSLDHEESVWVECELEWDQEQEAFVSSSFDSSWVLDEHAFPESSYFVRGTEFDTLEQACHAALRGRTKIPENDAPLVIHD